MSSGSKSVTGSVLLAPLALLLGLIAFVVSIAMFGSSSASCGGGGTVGALSPHVPKKLVPIYQSAAARYRLGQRGPSILAAINFVETSFGENMATSSAGANGWMAFLSSTWAEWGVDGDGDGDQDPYSAPDAIFSAANYLRDSGAPGDWHDAIFAYNHAEWYVEKVLGYEKEFAGAGSVEVEGGGECAVGAPNEAVAKMVAEAERLSRLRPGTEYVWGGSHGISPTPPNGPFDCSSAVSHLLQVAGFDNPTMDTIAFASWGDPGPGKWVTLHNKPYGAQAHIFIEFKASLTPAGKRYWGTSGFWFHGHGPGWIPESVFSTGYLAGFELRHPPGL